MKSEKELKEYAQQVGKEIVIRKYINGNSEDTRRQTNKEESKLIASVVYGSLLAINQKADLQSDLQSVADAAEYIIRQLLPEVNGYDTIYLPIKEYSF